MKRTASSLHERACDPVGDQRVRARAVMRPVESAIDAIRRRRDQLGREIE
jgi:hypothetical protein